MASGPEAGEHEQATALGAGKEVLHFFYDLTSVEQAKREDAALHLAQAMHISQKSFDGSHSHSNGGSGVQRGALALKGCSPLTVYALKRLVRGLGSGHDAARQGFSLALAAALVRVPEVESLPALDMLEAALEVSKSTKGSDAKDALLGRIFGYSAFCQAGRGASNAVADRLAASLIAVMGRKSFLREAAASALVACLLGLPPQALKHVLGSCEPLRDMLTRKPDEASPEDLLLALRMWPFMPADLLSDCPMLPRGCPAPSAGAFTGSDDARSAGTAGAAFMTAQHLDSLSGALADASASHPRIHSVWLTLLSLLIPGFTPVKVEDGTRAERGEVSSPALRALWAWVDGSLLASSHDRKYLAFQLFTLLLPSLRSEHVPFLLTPAFLRVLVNSLSKPDTHLHAAARRLIEQLARHAESSADATLRVAVVVALQRQRGGGFDRLTKTKYAANLLQGLDEEGLQAYSRHLQQEFQSPSVRSAAKAGQDADTDDDQDDADAEAAEEEHGPTPEDAARRWAVEQLSGGAMLTKGSPSTRLATLHFLTQQAFFAPGPDTQAAGLQQEAHGACEPPASDAVRQLCAARLIAGIDTASKAPGPALGTATGEASAKTDKANGNAQGTRRNRPDDAILADILRYIADLQDANGFALAAELPGELLSAVAALQALAEKAGKAARKADAPELAAKHRAFAVLARWLVLYMLGDPETAEAELASELAGIYRDAFPSTKGKKTEGGDAAPWMDRLVDMVLSLLAQASGQLPSAPLRDAVEGLFRLFASQLTSTGMEDLLRIVSTPDKGDAEGEEGIFDSDAEASEEDKLDEEDDEDEEDDKADDEDMQADEEDGAAAIAAALAAARPAGAADNDDEASTSGSEDDDEAMEASGMDAKIAAVLRATADAKESGRRAKEAVAQLRFRVAALLELYGKHQPDADLLMTALPALLSALRRALHAGPAQQPLANRLSGLVAKLSKSRAAGKLSEATGGAALKRLLYLASRADSKAFGQTASAALLFGIRHAADTETNQVVTDALEDYFTKKKSRLGAALMRSMLKERPSARAAKALLAFYGSARNAFLKAEAVQLLHALLHPNKENQASLAAGVSGLQPAVADLVQRVICESSVADVKAQRRADALSAACGIVEALQRLLPASEQTGLDGRAGALAEAAAEQLSSLQPTPGKVGTQLRRLAAILRKAGQHGSELSGEQQETAGAAGGPDATQEKQQIRARPIAGQKAKQPPKPKKALKKRKTG